MYSRDQLAQDDDLVLIPGEGTEIWEVTPGPGVTVTTQYPIYQTPETITPTPSGQAWQWSDIWKVLAPVAETGAKIYATVTGKVPQTGYPSPYPQTPTAGGVPPGYKYDPTTGRIVPIEQAGITTSPYFWPAVLGIGAFMLVSAARKR